MNSTLDERFIRCSHCGGTGWCEHARVVRLYIPYEYWHSFRECDVCGKGTLVGGLRADVPSPRCRACGGVRLPPDGRIWS